jgi:hypothetical protein
MFMADYGVSLIIPQKYGILRGYLAIPAEPPYREITAG